MLTTEQLATLKTDILADPTLAAMAAESSFGHIRAAYNLAADPAWYVWRSSVPVDEYRNAMTWTEVDALTAGKARIWEWLTQNMTQAINPSVAAVRSGLADCWASNTTTRAALLAIAYRKATRAEKLFSTGTGTTGSPATMGFEGDITDADVEFALRA